MRSLCHCCGAHHTEGEECDNSRDSSVSYPLKEERDWEDLWNQWHQHCVDKFGRIEGKEFFEHLYNAAVFFMWLKNNYKAI